MPAEAVSSVSSKLCTSRTRTCAPPGSSTSSAPLRTSPLHAVPVTIVPIPLFVHTRSIGMRKKSAVSRSPSARARSRSVSLSSAIPAPVTTDVRMIGAPSKALPLTRSRISSSTRPASASSTRSIFVIATTASLTPRSRSTSKCSSVCGMTPSSAATTRIARSTPTAPETIVLTKRSWPGTSTIPAATPPPRSSGAKPRTIEIPRSCSSLSRSVLRPVSAFTISVLPWSTCPDVPMMRLRTARASPRRLAAPLHSATLRIEAPIAPSFSSMRS
jgi:hypothetical protein